MRSIVRIGACLALGALLLAPVPVLAADATQEAILKKLDALQKRVTYLENKLSEAQQIRPRTPRQAAAMEAYARPRANSLKVSAGDRQDQGRASPGACFPRRASV